MVTAINRMLARQLACPDGTTGRLLGMAMDIVNRHPLNRAVDMLAPQPGEDILDAGCGTGAALAEMLKRAAVRPIGVDNSMTMLTAAQRRLAGDARLVYTRLEAMAMDNASFDAVLALNVLYFDDERASMLREMRRVLRPGGRLVAYVTHGATMRSWPFTRHGLHRLYDRENLIAAFTTAGFAPEALTVHEMRLVRSAKGLLVHAWY